MPLLRKLNQLNLNRKTPLYNKAKNCPTGGAGRAPQGMSESRGRRVGELVGCRFDPINKGNGDHLLKRIFGSMALLLRLRRLGQVYIIIPFATYSINQNHIKYCCKRRYYVKEGFELIRGSAAGRCIENRGSTTDSNPD